MVPSWCRQTITRIRPGTKTERGSTVFDWANATEKTISGCSVQPGSTSLNEDGRVLGISDGYTAYLPPNADVQAGDRIRYNGETYEIRGDIRPWMSATGACDHILLNLMRWDG